MAGDGSSRSAAKAGESKSSTVSVKSVSRGPGSSSISPHSLTTTTIRSTTTIPSSASTSPQTSASSSSPFTTSSSITRSTNTPTPTPLSTSAASTASQTTALSSSAVPSLAGSGTTTTTQTSTHHGISGGAIAAAVIFPILALVALAAIALFIIRRRKKRREDAEGSDNEESGMSSMPMSETKKGPVVTALEKETGSPGSITSPRNGGIGPIVAGTAMAAGALKPPPSFKRKAVGSPPSNITPGAAPSLPRDIVEPVSPIIELTPISSGPFRDHKIRYNTSMASTYATALPDTARSRGDDFSPHSAAPSTTDTTPVKNDELFISEPVGRHWHSVHGTSPRFVKDPRTFPVKSLRDEEDDISDLDDEDIEFGEVEIREAGAVTRQRASVIDMELGSTPPKETKL